ncbi:CRISPR-associated endonuclease Cas9 [subsurface metagenome]
MSKILGLDLGTNSIGWAIIDNKSINDYGVKVYPKRNRQSKTYDLKIRLSRKVLLGSIMTSFLFAMAVININDWRYWTSLAIGGVLLLISMIKDN